MKKTLVAFLLCSGMAAALSAKSSQYFPQLGRAAEFQRMLELKHPAVLLCISPHPGDEDFPLMAYARLGIGVRVVSVYVTNGEAVQSSLAGDVPSMVAAQRKEEAYEACSKLNSDVYYLNFPDPGIVSDSADLAQIWNRDSVIARLTYALRHFRPDAVVLFKDRRVSDRNTPTDLLLSDLVESAAVQSTNERSKVMEKPWRVARFVFEYPGLGINDKKPYSKIHPIWKKSYQSIAAEVAESYRTLRIPLQCSQTAVGRSYAFASALKRPVSISPDRILGGLPKISPPFKGIMSVVDRLTKQSTKVSRMERISLATDALDSLTAVLNRSKSSFKVGDERILATLYSGLQDLRCTLQGINIDVEASDTMLTVQQIFYLRIKKLSPKPAGEVRILFPFARDKTWWVNESPNSDFALNPPQQFVILSPASMEMNAPTWGLGLFAGTPRKRFPFLIYHQDAVRTKSFLYRGEVLLQIGPRRSFVVSTPVVRAIDGARIISVIQNLSRDPYKGQIGVYDSLINVESHDLYLPPKDAIVMDTLHLSFRSPLAPGDYPVRVRIGQEEEVRTVVARSFDVLADTSRRVCVLSTIRQSQVVKALEGMAFKFDVLENSIPGEQQLQA